MIFGLANDSYQSPPELSISRCFHTATYIHIYKNIYVWPYYNSATSFFFEENRNLTSACLFSRSPHLTWPNGAAERLVLEGFHEQIHDAGMISRPSYADLVARKTQHQRPLPHPRRFRFRPRSLNHAADRRRKKRPRRKQAAKMMTTTTTITMMTTTKAVAEVGMAASVMQA